MLASLLLLVGFAAPSPTWHGVLKFVGSEPFAELVLEDDQGRQWVLRGDIQPLLDEGQGRHVRVAGTEKKGRGAVIQVTAWEWLPEEDHD